jgi:hypothetical protein
VCRDWLFFGVLGVVQSVAGPGSRQDSQFKCGCKQLATVCKKRASTTLDDGCTGWMNSLYIHARKVVLKTAQTTQMCHNLATSPVPGTVSQMCHSIGWLRDAV